MSNKSISINEVKKKERILYFDMLNIFACISVIFLHMNGHVYEYSNTLRWKVSLIFEVICYWAVPIFVMLSGAKLLRYRERYDTETFFNKRFLKILIPWIVWSIIIHIINNNGHFNILTFLIGFLYGRIAPIYWFFPMILSMYCLIPVFSIFTQKEEYRKILKGIVLYFFIFSGIMNPLYKICNMALPDIFNYFFSNNNRYIMFLLLGYLLSTEDITKKKRIIIYVLGIVSALIRYVYTYYMSIKEGMLNQDLFDYCSVFSVFLAIAVFVFIKNVNWSKIFDKLKINSKLIEKISCCSFGIYLIHIIVKDQLNIRLGLDVYSFLYKTIGAICLYLICLAIVYVMKKIPILRKIVP